MLLRMERSTLTLHECPYSTFLDTSVPAKNDMVDRIQTTHVSLPQSQTASLSQPHAPETETRPWTEPPLWPTVDEISTALEPIHPWIGFVALAMQFAGASLYWISVLRWKLQRYPYETATSGFPLFICCFGWGLAASMVLGFLLRFANELYRRRRNRNTPYYVFDWISLGFSMLPFVLAPVLMPLYAGYVGSTSASLSARGALCPGMGE